MTFRAQSIAALLAVICGTGCILRSQRTEIDEPNGVRWACAEPGNPAEGMAITIADWARREQRDSARGTAFRTAYGLTGHPSEIAIVRDPTLCARAGRAYARRDSVPPFLYHVALVRVGRRYIALNMNSMQRAGEFMLEAILDDRFRFLGWVGT